MVESALPTPSCNPWVGEELSSLSLTNCCETWENPYLGLQFLSIK